MANNWIDKLKAERAKREEVEPQRGDLRLQRTAILKARMPLFLSHTLSALNDDLGRLKREFPHTPQYHLTLQYKGPSSFRVLNSVPPRIILNVQYNEDGQFISIAEETGADSKPSSPLVPGANKILRINLIDDEQISLQDQDESLTGPEMFAEYLCKWVARIHE